MMAHEVRALLRAYLPAQEYALFFEVADATGARQSRWADAVAMSLWPSRGLVVHGYEIKVSRSDWLSELSQPMKAEAIFNRVDFWWLICPANVTKLEEIPDAWGWLAVNDGRISVMKQAPRHDALPLDRTFFASLARSAGKVDRGELSILVDAEVEKRRAGDKAQNDREVERRLGNRAQAETMLAKVIERMGQDGLHLLNDDEFCDAFALALRSHACADWRGARAVHKHARDMLENVEKSMTEMGMEIPVTPKRRSMR
jgi:hypothetical protein